MSGMQPTQLVLIHLRRLCACSIIVVVALGLGSIDRNQSANAVQPEREPDYIMVTHGIVGGIIPPHVRHRAIIVSADDEYRVFVMKQAARNEPARYYRGTLNGENFAKLSRDVGELWTLPVEHPAGSQDIYQRDISITARIGKNTWRNGGPEGCVHGQSTVQATAEQRERFSQLVKLIDDLAEAHADQQATAEDFATALKSVQPQSTD